MKFVLAALLALIAGGALAAPFLFSGGGGTAEARFGAERLDVTLREWTLETSTDRIQAGPVSLRMRNEGGIEHDLLVVRTDRPADSLPVGLFGVAPDIGGDVVFGELHRDHDHSGGVEAASGEHLLPGGAAGAEIDLTPGAYVLICPLRGHYENGQRAALTVE